MKENVIHTEIEDKEAIVLDNFLTQMVKNQKSLDGDISNFVDKHIFELV